LHAWRKTTSPSGCRAAHFKRGPFFVDHSGIGRHEGSTRPIYQMHSGAGRAPQRNVREVIVRRRVIIKPSLHVLARGGTSIDYAGHLVRITRFRDRRFLEPKHQKDVSLVPLGGSGAWRDDSLQEVMGFFVRLRWLPSWALGPASSVGIVNPTVTPAGKTLSRMSKPRRDVVKPPKKPQAPVGYRIDRL
jgi:hypothetical protein